MTQVCYIDETHAIDLQSWVESANAPETDFPIQNLPYGRFRPNPHSRWRPGVAIGDRVLDLQSAGLIDFDDMNQLVGFNKPQRVALRAALSQGLRKGSDRQQAWSSHLYPQAQVELGLPCDTRDYTDFYTGIYHAIAAGKLFRPDQPLLPNYKFVPIGYHGRASSIVPSGTSFKRPQGQIKQADALTPRFGSSQRLDFELEMGVVIGAANILGEPVPLRDAEDHIFGLTLFNDWSARDIQAWEYQPLGPFLGKSFASTISPWTVTLEALAPFRSPCARPAADPQLLPYLVDQTNQQAGSFDVDLEVFLQTENMRQAGLDAERICYSNFSEAAYWTIAQLVTQQTVNGCNLGVGDLLGTGTLSGPRPEQAGSMLELSQGGKQTFQLSNGESRVFLQDGDRITLRGHCTRPGFRKIGFGDCTGTVLSSNQQSLY